MDLDISIERDSPVIERLGKRVCRCGIPAACGSAGKSGEGNGRGLAALSI